jgi:hypothetical protein
MLRGAEDIARGDLAAALGDLPNTVINPQPLDHLSIPNSVEDTLDERSSAPLQNVVICSSSWPKYDQLAPE